jgi:glycerophosphoryl diester phosphodiesterase
MPRRIAVIPVLLVLPLLVGLAAVPAHAARNLWRQVPTWNIAHQGGEDEFPSNTLYAFRKALAAGANMLELDIGVTKDGQIVVMHDTTVDRITNGRGTIASKTLAQMQKLDGAYWFTAAGSDHYRHGRPASTYRFRGVATGRKPPPRGFSAADFRVPTLKAVLKAFPHTPINVEIKGRTKQEAVSEYLTNADALARLLRPVHRKDVIVVSFKQPAVERFHTLVPGLPLAPGVDGDANWLLAGGSPGAGVVAFQVPITYKVGSSLIQISTAENVARAHREGYAWQTWFANQDVDGPASWRKLIDACVDGVMTSKPTAFERVRRSHREPSSCPRS